MKKSRRNLGFTLLETLLVVGMTVILLSIGIVEVVKYQRTLFQLEMDGIAKEIFVAAQNNLSMVYGQNYLGKEDPAVPDSVGNQEIRPVSDTETKPTGAYYFVVNDADRALLDSEDSILSLLLPEGSVDETVRMGGSYIIRYDKASGLVLDVFYADTADRRFKHSFAESEYYTLFFEGEDERGLRSDAKKSKRRNYTDEKSVIGYYGGLKPSGEQSDALKKPSLRLYNKEVLFALVDVPDTTPEDAEVVLVVEGANARKEITLRTKDTNSGDLNFAVILDAVRDVSLSELAAYAENAYRIDLSRYSLIERTDNHFSALDPAFEPGENITVTAVIREKKGITVIKEAASAAKPENSLFASYDENDTVEISCIRHLENLGSPVSGLDMTDLKAKQTAELTWTGNFNAAAPVKAGADSSITGTFYPVIPPEGLAYIGGSHSIKGIVVNYPRRGGLFGSMAGGSVENLKLIDFDISVGTKEEKSTAGALAGELVNTTVSGVLAYNDQKNDDSGLGIHADICAGGLIGSMTGGSVEKSAAALYVSALVKDKDGATSVAGGLIGQAAGTTVVDSYSGGHTVNARYMDNMSDSGRGHANVFAETAGGLIGSFVKGESEKEPLVSFCYSTCSVYGSGIAGGFIGELDHGIVENCYETGKVMSSAAEEKAGTFVGFDKVTGTTDAGTTFIGDIFLGNISVDENIRNDAREDGTIIAIAGNDFESADAKRLLIDADANKAAGYARASANVYDIIIRSDFESKYYFLTIDQMHKIYTNHSRYDAVHGAYTFDAAKDKGTLLDTHYGDFQIPILEDMPFTFVNGDTLRIEIDIKEMIDKLDENGLNTFTLVLNQKNSANSDINIRGFLFAVDKTAETLTLTGEVDNAVNTNWGEWPSPSISIPITKTTDGKWVLTLDDITKAGGHFADIFKDSAGNPYWTPGTDLYARIAGGEATSWAAVKKAAPGSQMQNTLFEGVYSKTADITHIRHLQNLDPLISGLDTSLVTGAKLSSNLDWNAKPDGIQWSNAKVYNKDSSKSNDAEYFYGLYNNKLTTFDGNSNALKNFKFFASDDIDAVNGANNGGLFRKVAGNMTISDLDFIDCWAVPVNGVMVNAGLAVAEHTSDTLTLSHITIKEETHGGSNDVESATGSAGGLVGHSDGNVTADNITSDHMNITSRNPDDINGCAGGIAGLVKGNFTCLDTNILAETVIGNYDAGGVVGRVVGKAYIGKTEKDNDGNVTYRHDVNIIGADVESAAGHAGGIAARVEKGAEISNVYIDSMKKLKADGKSYEEDSKYVFKVHAKVKKIGTEYVGGYAGGLIGYFDSQAPLKTENVLVLSETGTIIADKHSAGGLIGGINVSGSGISTIDNSAATIVVKADTYGNGDAGGLIGVIEQGNVSITNSYAGGHTVGTAASLYGTANYNITSAAGNAGGLVGHAQSGTLDIKKSFSAASVKAASAAGGLIGQTDNGTTTKLDMVYTVAPVSGVKAGETNANKGAFAGNFGGMVENPNDSCYYLPEVYSGYDADDTSTAVQTIGNGNTLNVKFAYYERDISETVENENEISAKTYTETMQQKTVPYNQALKTGNINNSSREYPFSIWTTLSYDLSDIYKDLDGNSIPGMPELTYYGDWQPVVVDPTEMKLASFQYLPWEKDGSSAGASAPFLTSADVKNLRDVCESPLQTQNIIKDAKNQLVIPATEYFPGYKVRQWEYYALKEDGKTVDLTKRVLLTEKDGMVTIPKEYSDTDCIIVARYVKDDNANSITFLYNKNLKNDKPDDIVWDNMCPPREVSAAQNQWYHVVEHAPSMNFEGYRFVGWYKDPAFKNEWSADTSDGDSVGPDSIAYAKYEKLEYYYITVDYKYTIDDGETASRSGPVTSIPRYGFNEKQGQVRYKIVKDGKVHTEIIPFLDFIDSKVEVEVGQVAGTENATATITHKDGEWFATSKTMEDTHYEICFKIKGVQDLSDYYYYYIETVINDTRMDENGQMIYSAGSSVSTRYSNEYGDMYTYPMIPGATETDWVPLIPDFDLSDTVYRDENGVEVGRGFGALYGDGLKLKTKQSQMRAVDTGATNPDDGKPIYKFVLTYDRQKFMLTYDTVSGTPYLKTQELSYGAPIPKPTNITRSGYLWDRWEVSYVGTGEVYTLDTMPAHHMNATAIWKTDKADYRVQFWIENANDSDYSFCGSTVYTGATGSEVSSSNYYGSNYQNYLKPFLNGEEQYFSPNKARTETKTINPDGTTVLNAYYSRNYYTLTFVDSDIGKITVTHTHDEDCYVYSCDLTEHTHTADCLICTKPVHQHDETCCTVKDHTHTADCYGTVPHVHTDECYTEQLICGMSEHQHNNRCNYTKGKKVDTDTVGGVKANKNNVEKIVYDNGKYYRCYSEKSWGTTYYYWYEITYTCGKTEHTHNAGCYGDVLICKKTTETILTCTLPEHTHGDGHCSCPIEEHVHSDAYGCYKDIAHTHNADCKKLICGFYENDGGSGDDKIPSGAVYYLTRKYKQTLRSDKDDLDDWNFTGQNGVEYPNYQVEEATGKDRWGDYTYDGTVKYYPIDEYTQKDGDRNKKLSSWKASNSSQFTERFINLLTMPGENLTLNVSRNSNKSKVFYYYVEAVDQNLKQIGENQKIYKNKKYDLLLKNDVDFNYATYAEDFFEIDGYSKGSATYSQNGQVDDYTIVTWSNDGSYKPYGGKNDTERLGENSRIYFYYNINSYNLQYIVNNKDAKPAEPVKFGTDLSADYYSKYEPGNKPGAGYTFSGWFKDAQYQEPYNFTGKKMTGAMALYGYWVTPIVNVTFTAGTEPNVTFTEKTLTVHMGEKLTDEVSDNNGSTWKEAFKPTRPGYEFVGWRYGADADIYAPSMTITSALTLYPEWIPVSTTENQTRHVYVRHYYDVGGHQYFDVDDYGIHTVGDVFAVTAKEKLGEAAIKAGVLTELSDAYNSTVTVHQMYVEEQGDDDPYALYYDFKYRYAEPWYYQIRYKVRFNSYLEAGVTGLADSLIGKYDKKDDTTYWDVDLDIPAPTKDGYPATSNYETIEFRLPTGFEDYHLKFYQYRDTIDTATAVTIHKESIDDIPVVTYYIEPDPSKIQVGDRMAVYSGASPVKDLSGAVNDLNGLYQTKLLKDSGYTLELHNVYRYCKSDGTPLDDTAVVNVGSYKMDGYVVLHVEKGTTVKDFLLWQDISHLLNLRIAPRPITIYSAYASQTYDINKPLTASGFSLPESYTLSTLAANNRFAVSALTGMLCGDILIVGPENELPLVYNTAAGKNDGLAINFTVEAFRKEKGSSQNAFAYSFLSDEIARNYQVETKFGVLTVN